jgi:hypothetical protein
MGLQKKIYVYKGKRSSSEPHGSARQQAIAETPAKWSAHHIPSVIVVFEGSINYPLIITQQDAPNQP